MRVAVIILGLFLGLVLLDHTVLPLRLMLLVRSGEWSLGVVSSLALFMLWAVATALVYGYPGLAGWLFALAGGTGLYQGITNSIADYVLWGGIAVGLSALTGYARREKQRADQHAWARTQHELAVHAALRSLHESMPELLSRTPDAADRDYRPRGLVELRPHTARDAARREEHRVGVRLDTTIHRPH